MFNYRCSCIDAGKQTAFEKRALFFFFTNTDFAATGVTEGCRYDSLMFRKVRDIASSVVLAEVEAGT